MNVITLGDNLGDNLLNEMKASLYFPFLLTEGNYPQSIFNIRDMLAYEWKQAYVWIGAFYLD